MSNYTKKIIIHLRFSEYLVNIPLDEYSPDIHFALIVKYYYYYGGYMYILTVFFWTEWH